MAAQSAVVGHEPSPLAERPGESVVVVRVERAENLRFTIMTTSAGDGHRGVRAGVPRVATSAVHGYVEDLVVNHVLAVGYHEVGEQRVVIRCCPTAVRLAGSDQLLDADQPIAASPSFGRRTVRSPATNQPRGGAFWQRPGLAVAQ